jgi:hypothetical protein
MSKFLCFTQIDVCSCVCVCHLPCVCVCVCVWVCMCLCVGVQPAVCTRELCVFSFYTLGVMSGAAEEVATGAEVTA